MNALGSSPSLLADFSLCEPIIQLARKEKICLGGSLYAAPAHERLAMADALARAHLWAHADFFAPGAEGVDLTTMDAILAREHGLLDAHLLNNDALVWFDSLATRPLDRLTLPLETDADLHSAIATLRHRRISPWLALAPQSTIAEAEPFLESVDGVLVMLIAPGTKDAASLSLLDKNRALRARGVTNGVDGGVTAETLPRIVQAGASYLVIGRSMLAQSFHQKEETS
ncbi:MULTISPECIES: beta/alpha barrel domain-containing protein [Asaia]|uniref:hypothetical protein n=1 Tax=Asaia TaxID=91914 RepID=UPI002FC346DB